MHEQPEIVAGKLLSSIIEKNLGVPKRILCYKPRPKKEDITKWLKQNLRETTKGLTERQLGRMADDFLELKIK